MSDSSNVLGLSGDAEQALLKLALRFELITGMQLNWRQNAEAVENLSLIHISEPTRPY